MYDYWPFSKIIPIDSLIFWNLTASFLVQFSPSHVKIFVTSSKGQKKKKNGKKVVGSEQRCHKGYKMSQMAYCNIYFKKGRFTQLLEENVKQI